MEESVADFWEALVGSLSEELVGILPGALVDVPSS